jgi:phosphotriesterase-related protein
MIWYIGIYIKPYQEDTTMSQMTNRTTYLTMLVFLLATLCIAATGKTIYVDDDATGVNDGTSWANAYNSLQDALAIANSAAEPVEIRVAQGVYRPNEGLMAVPEFDWRTTTFQLINGVTIEGGYAGSGELDPDVRDVETYKTILSGDLNANDVEVVDPYHLWDEPTRADNSYHVVTGSRTDETAILDGFSITAGNANGERGTPASRGAGIYNVSGSPNLTNCTFIENSASEGCGIYNSGSNPTLANCIFVWNEAEHSGGGMYNDNSNPVIKECTFNGNSAFFGGGMDNSESSPILINCAFSGNVALLIVWPNGDWMGGDGGGIHNFNSNPTLTNCTFIDNFAWQGGGMDNSQSSPILTNCKFSGNFSVEHGGGMSSFLGSPTLAYSIFSGNMAAQYGGGMDNSESNPSLMNCTFSDNSADSGGGMGNFKSAPTLTNCILWGNTAGSGEQIELIAPPSSVSISYSDLQGGQAAVYDPCEALVWGEGNIDIDPFFVKYGYWADINKPNVIVEPFDPNAIWVDGDYHLKSEAGRWDPISESWVQDDMTSPCIDIGDPNSDWVGETWPHGERINMGAYGGTAEASKSDYSWWFATTEGPVVAERLGIILPHEHIFTDLRGPTTQGYGQADPADVVRVMAPLLEEARQKGVGLLFECSSIGVGRNVSIVAQVAQASGLPVVVPTGVYGRANFAPPEHRNMSEDELTALFINEIREGIDGTGIKAGFIKIATGDGPITALEEKFLRAAGRAARETGAAIASHTPRGSNASRQADILESISPAIRLIWVHAQNESNSSVHRQLAARGVFIEFDSLGWNPGQDSSLITAIKELLASGYGDRILLSHDAGWYRPGQRNGGTQMPYTYLVETFIPKLGNSGIDDAAIRMMTETNPIRAFGFKSKE